MRPGPLGSEVVGRGLVWDLGMCFAMKQKEDWCPYAHVTAQRPSLHRETSMPILQMQKL